MFLVTVMISKTESIARSEGTNTGGPETRVDTRVPGASIELPDPLGGGTIIDLLRKIVDWLQKIANPIAAIMIIYGAYQILFAGGEAEKVKTGRNTIIYAAVGYGIILIGWGLTSIISEFFG